MTQLYPLAPASEPGEDDLGALSSWYVWAALGLYPETPGAADLVMTSPLFPRADITLGNGRTLDHHRLPCPRCSTSSGARLAVGSGAILGVEQAVAAGLGPRERREPLQWTWATLPDKAWGSVPSAAPPSFSHGAAPAVAFTTPGGSLTVPAGGSATVFLGVQEASGASGSPRTVTWHAVPSAGTTISPASGSLPVVDGRSTTPLVVTPAKAGTSTVTFDLTQGGEPLPSLTLDVDATAP